MDNCYGLRDYQLVLERQIVWKFLSAFGLSWYDFTQKRPRKKGGSTSYIEGVASNKIILFPEVIDDYIEEDSPVRFIDAFVDSLDLQELGFKYSKPEATGRPPYNPACVVRLHWFKKKL